MEAECGRGLTGCLLKGFCQPVGPGVAYGQSNMLDGQRGVDEQVFGAFDAASGDFGSDGMAQSSRNRVPKSVGSSQLLR
jgi:hypothetical protein